MAPTASHRPATSRRLSGIAILVLVLSGTAATADPLQSFGEALSDDGRYVVFMSNATDLVPGQVDTNHGYDAFLRDRFARTTTLISHAAGSPTTAADTGFIGSFAGPLSADRRYLLLLSDATNLTPGLVDANQTIDLFLYDRLLDKFTLLSRAAGAAGVAANGATVNGLISRDGNVVAFTSLARNLVPGQVDGNQQPGFPDSGGDVFLYHRPSGSLSLVTHKSGSSNTTANGSSAVSGISADGSVVVFTSTASDLVGGLADTNGKADVFVYQRASGAVAAVSRASGPAPRTANGFSGGGQVSDDGRWIAFQSSGDNLVNGQVETGALYDEFLFDRVTGKNLLVSHKSGSPTRAVGAGPHTFSADGRYLAFASAAPDLVGGQVDTNGKMDVFLYDRVAATLSLVTHRAGAFTTTTSGSAFPGLAIDGAGRNVVILSDAPDLVPGQIDAQGRGDAFLYDRVTRRMSLVSHRRGALKTAADGGTTNAEVSRDGSTVGFTSAAGDLTEDPADTDGGEDVFAYLSGTRQVEEVSRPAGDPFVACTLLDTRDTLGALVSGLRSSVAVTGHCGVPTTARSVALTVTALQSTARGSLRLYPGNVTDPPSGVLHFPFGATRTGSFTLSLATDGAGTLAILPQVAGHGTVHVVVVVTGYSD